ncbi:MAG: type II secretion system protein [Candidatus Paceibacterota bacterium]|jgi:prepilin-type N-terminal cleavage/methylation domain-containing protein
MKVSSVNNFHLKGFTLLELLVSLSIMLIMTGVLFMRYPETVKRLTLANMTHTTALLIREAQVRGSAVDSFNSSIGGYGVYMALANPNKLILFGDVVDGTLSTYQILVGDGLFQNENPVDETKTVTFFPKGYNVTKLCVGSGFPFICNTDNTPPITTLTVSFTRPNPQPNIYVNDSKATNYSTGCVELHSPLAPLGGHVRSVQFFNSGMIRTLTTACDNNP